MSNMHLASESAESRGYLAATAAFVIWGFFPIYLFGLARVSAMQITAHRIVWSLVFVIPWLAVTNELPRLRAALANKAVLLRLAASAFLICLNWVGFAWAVNHDRVLDVSVAYYMAPLINVLLGVFVLSERLDRVQWVAVALTAAGVVYLAFISGHAPWLAVMIGASFAVYGLIRKTVAVEALPGLAVETIILTPVALAYLVWCEAAGNGVIGHSSTPVGVLLLFSGVVTAVPLVLFAYGARRIHLTTMGVIQFIGPTLQLVCGLVIFREPFPSVRAIGFGLIWIGLLIYAAHGWYKHPVAGKDNRSPNSREQSTAA